MADVMCSWCHEMNTQNGLALTPYCLFCGHRADVPRAQCDCPKCEKPDDRVYLGDGVYVSDYFGDLKLETDRDGVTHWIVLGPSEYAALLAYVDRAKAG